MIKSIKHSAGARPKKYPGICTARYRLTLLPSMTETMLSSASQTAQTSRPTISRRPVLSTPRLSHSATQAVPHRSQSTHPFSHPPDLPRQGRSDDRRWQTWAARLPDWLGGFTYRLAPGPGPGMTYPGRRPRCSVTCKVWRPSCRCSQHPSLSQEYRRRRYTQSLWSLTGVPRLVVGTQIDKVWARGKPRGCEVPNAQLAMQAVQQSPGW